MNVGINDDAGLHRDSFRREPISDEESAEQIGSNYSAGRSAVLIERQGPAFLFAVTSARQD